MSTRTALKTGLGGDNLGVVHLGSGTQLPSNELGAKSVNIGMGHKHRKGGVCGQCITSAGRKGVSRQRGSQGKGEVNWMCGRVSHSLSVQGHIGRQTRPFSM
jgi:hypothetical protein